MKMNKILPFILALLPLGVYAQPLDTNLDEYLQPLLDRIEALEDRVDELEAVPPVVVEPPVVVGPPPDPEPPQVSEGWLTPEDPEDSIYLPEDATADDLVRAVSGESSVYLPAGAVFEVDSLRVSSGGSEGNPRVLGVYGDGPRPLIRVRGSPALGISEGVEHLVVSGWELYRPTNNPDDELWDPGDSQGYGVSASGAVSHILIEDCRVSFFGQGLVFVSPEAECHDITLHRNIVLFCWKRNDRGEGLYTNRVRNLTASENVFAHNGWHPSVSSRDSGALHTRGTQAHGCYFSGRYNSGVPKKWAEADKGDEFVVQFHGNAVLDSSANGAQFRLGGVVHDNVFSGNPMAFYTWTNPSEARRNAVTNGTHISYDSGTFWQRGWGIQVIAEGEYSENVIANVSQASAGSHAIVYEHSGAKVHNNVFYRWGSNKDRPDGPVWNKNNSDPSGFSDNLVSSDPDLFVDASREVTEDHRSYWTQRPRQSWDPSQSPSSVSAWIRAGFEVTP